MPQAPGLHQNQTPEPPVPSQPAPELPVLEPPQRKRLVLRGLVQIPLPEPGLQK